MTPATIVRDAQADHVMLTLSDVGTIKVHGDQEAVSRWLPVFREHKAAIVGFLQQNANEAEPAFRWWSLHFLDRDPLEVACCPPATQAEILKQYRSAVAAEPVIPAVLPPDTPLSGDEEQAIRSWLFVIGETDVVTIGVVLSECHENASARAYFLLRSSQEAADKGDS